MLITSLRDAKNSKVRQLEKKHTQLSNRNKNFENVFITSKFKFQTIVFASISALFGTIILPQLKNRITSELPTKSGVNRNLKI